jgi:hypothetical protein
VTPPQPSWILVDDASDERLAPFRLRERGLASRLDRREPGGVDSLNVAAAAAIACHHLGP